MEPGASPIPLPCSPGGVRERRGDPWPPTPCPSIPGSPGGTPGWKRGVSPIPLPSDPHSPGGILGWRWGTITTCPMFSGWGAGMEVGNHAHPSHVLQEGQQGGEGCHGHPPHCPASQFSRRDAGVEMGVPHPHVPPSQGRTLGVRQGITSTHPKHSRRMLGWRGGPMSSVSAPSRCDPCTEPVSRTAQAGRWDGDGILHLPWETQPSLGTSLIAGGGASCFLAASSPLRAAWGAAEFSQRCCLPSLASGQGSDGLGKIPLQRPQLGGTTGLGAPRRPALPMSPMGTGPCGFRSLLASSLWRLRHIEPPVSWGQPAMSPLKPWDLSRH